MSLNIFDKTNSKLKPITSGAPVNTVIADNVDEEVDVSQGIIKNLFNLIKTKVIYPITRTDAVYDKNGVRLDNTLAGLQGYDKLGEASKEDESDLEITLNYNMFEKYSLFVVKTTTNWGYSSSTALVTPGTYRILTSPNTESRLEFSRVGNTSKITLKEYKHSTIPDQLVVYGLLKR